MNSKVAEKSKDLRVKLAIAKKLKSYDSTIHSTSTFQPPAITGVKSLAG